MPPGIDGGEMTERPTTPGGTGFEYYKAVCRTSELTPRQKLVAMIIRNHWSPAEEFNPSNELIARQAGCGKRQVQRELVVLKKLGWLRGRPRKATTTVWTPRIPSGTPRRTAPLPPNRHLSTRSWSMGPLDPEKGQWWPPPLGTPRPPSGKPPQPPSQHRPSRASWETPPSPTSPLTRMASVTGWTPPGRLPLHPLMTVRTPHGMSPGPPIQMSPGPPIQTGFLQTRFLQTGPQKRLQTPLARHARRARTPETRLQLRARVNLETGEVTRSRGWSRRSCWRSGHCGRVKIYCPRGITSANPIPRRQDIGRRGGLSISSGYRGCSNFETKQSWTA